ncbi:unnamed protein product [Brassicogethes aeneus]|uniref:Alpha-amylase n=1 Tax=Brassicogethes aeneus TaxID=1431903 RepID=A0A9P0FES3_BRAAE|nr:unnamed protein product [Brassicogethes aeneus]
MKCLQVCAFIALFVIASTQWDAHFANGRTSIVHLFEWKWSDIAAECERFLGPKGFGGVQISPPNENLVISNYNRVWWERYQPVSYKLITRSGNENEFKNMVDRCNAVNVRIYVDTVINHMSAGSGTGTGGSSGDVENKNFPGVPYSINDFHSTCKIDNYQDATNVRNCELAGLKDLDQGNNHVRNKIREYMNHLIDLGVAGFRIDAAKHMSPNDLKIIYAGLKDTKFGGKPFIYQEVIDFGGEPIKKTDYTGIGNVLEFLYGKKLSNMFRGNDKLTYLVNWGPAWGLLDGLKATCFIDNHDNQRYDSNSILTYKKPKQYKMAIAFMLAHPYGTARIMSSYLFNDKDQPAPQDAQKRLISPGFKPDGTCTNGYVCEHRWREIYNMIQFRNIVLGTPITNWWSNNVNQIAFGRGNKGFIAFTQEGDIKESLPTSLPDGTYCDVISGDLTNGSCTGKSVVVSGGKANIQLGQNEFDGMVAIHVQAKKN